MKLRTVVGFLLLFGFCPFGGLVRGATTNDTPDFKEVYDLLRANLAAGNEAELNRGAVRGLLSEFQSRVTLLDPSKQVGPAVNSESAIRAGIFDGSYGYLRIGRVGPGTDKEVMAAYQKLGDSNKLKGVVFDLRFAGGEDYAAAASLADWFFSNEKPMLDYGAGVKNSTAKTNAFSLPLTLLVNQQTKGAAEAFAGVLRQADIGLLIGGTNTAGQASMGKEFTLKTGQHLWIATSLIKLGNGQPFPVAGLKPDIQVEVSPQDEQAYFEDAYKVLPKAGHLANVTTNQTNLSLTNRPTRHRTTEAELVQMHRDGQLPEGEGPSGKSRNNETHVVYDPALARAIDLLKGLSVVQHFRSI